MHLFSLQIVTAVTSDRLERGRNEWREQRDIPFDREREVKQRARDKRKKRWKGHRPSVGRHRLEKVQKSRICACVW